MTLSQIEKLLDNKLARLENNLVGILKFNHLLIQKKLILKSSCHLNHQHLEKQKHKKHLILNVWS